MGCYLGRMMGEFQLNGLRYVVEVTMGVSVAHKCRMETKCKMHHVTKPAIA